MPNRRFPPPRSAEETDACFIVKDFVTERSQPVAAGSAPFTLGHQLGAHRLRRTRPGFAQEIVYLSLEGKHAAAFNRESRGTATEIVGDG
jgi:hypothetical protein